MIYLVYDNVVFDIYKDENKDFWNVLIVVFCIKNSRGFIYCDEKVNKWIFVFWEERKCDMGMDLL